MLARCPVLLEQVQGEIASVMADGAYDGEPVYRAIAARQPQAPPSIVIPLLKCRSAGRQALQHVTAKNGLR